MPYENILVDTRERVGFIRLNRPQRLNALNDALADVAKSFGEETTLLVVSPEVEGLTAVCEKYGATPA